MLLTFVFRLPLWAGPDPEGGWEGANHTECPQRARSLAIPRGSTREHSRDGRDGVHPNSRGTGEAEGRGSDDLVLVVDQLFVRSQSRQRSRGRRGTRPTDEWERREEEGFEALHSQQFSSRHP